MVTRRCLIGGAVAAASCPAQRRPLRRASS